MKDFTNFLRKEMNAILDIETPTEDDLKRAKELNVTLDLLTEYLQNDNK